MHEAVGNCSIHMYLLSNCFVFNLVLDLTCTFQLILHVHLANMYFSNISILKTFKFCFFNKIKKGSIDLKEIETLVIFASKLNIYYCVIVFYTWPSIRKSYENAAFKLIWPTKKKLLYFFSLWQLRGRRGGWRWWGGGGGRWDRWRRGHSWGGGDGRGGGDRRGVPGGDRGRRKERGTDVLYCLDDRLTL